MIVGVEGPAGAGKSTMAQTVARERGAVVIEGGAWYRALAYVALQRGIDWADTEKLRQLASELNIEPHFDIESTTKLLLDGEDVTDQLYQENVSQSVPLVAGQLEIRAEIEPKIIAAVRSQPEAIIVGRHLKRALPEIPVLRVSISDDEANRRHHVRSGDSETAVSNRNDMDAVTALKLGTVVTNATVVDVSDLSMAAQADVLRQFIKNAET